MSAARRVPWLLTGALLAVASCVSSSALELYETSDAPCYDRALEPQTAVVDAHLHFRPFGGPEIPFEELVSYLEETGVLFANVYGIGQTLPDSSSCTYYLDCPGTPLTPSLDNDLANAAEYVTNPPSRVHLTMSMTFPDLARPATILPAMQRLEEEYPGVFSWMGEVNPVKQAVFDNGRRPIPEEVLDGWAPAKSATLGLVRFHRAVEPAQAVEGTDRAYSSCVARSTSTIFSMRKLLSGSGPAGAGPDSPGSCDDEHSQGASSLFPGLSTLPGPLTPFYTNIATLPAGIG